MLRWMLWTAVLLSALESLPAGAAAGDLDTTFGGSGKVVTAYGGPTMFDPHVLAQPDGKLVVVGRQFNGHDDDFVALRFLANGTLDPAFGTGGVTTVAFSPAQDMAKNLALQADGKIVLGGVGRRAGAPYDMHALTRLNADGTLDTTFGGKGLVVTDFGLPSHIHAVAVQSDGKIVVVGESYSTEDGGTLAAARYLSNGTLDSSFGSGGRLEQTLGTGTNAHALIVQADGKILIGGYATNATTAKVEFFVARYSSAGVLDTSFGSSGVSTVAIGSGLNYCHSMQLQSDGMILLAGGAMTATNHDFAVARFSSNGVLDSSFGSGGVVTTEFTSSSSPSIEEAAAAVVQPDGKIVLGGYSSKKFALARYLSTGALDTSFGSGGKLTLALGSEDDFIKGLALQADGKIVASGYSRSSGTFYIALARLQNDSSAALPNYERVFNWAEGVLPGYFPRGPVSQSISGYIARIYSNGYALGIKDDRVYAYGAALGGLYDAGPIDPLTTMAISAGY